ncbi:MAG: DNA-processing protein DprA [Chloroflexota bacterium]
MDDLKFWVALSRVSRVGPIRFRLLETRFGDMETAWRASEEDLLAAGLDRPAAMQIAEARRQLDPDGEMERLEREGVRAVHVRSPEYPERLGELYDAPPVLFVRGSLAAEDERAVAVVGTRSCTSYGREMATRLATELVGHSITVVSGLARGVDGIAHQAALDAGGRTIGVVASGVDIVYPAEHARLAKRMVENGAVVSEYPLGVRPQARNFPRRNRILSGLALGTLVVEAGRRSGALLTVAHALEQNREVFAVPGSALSAKSGGTNWLIQQGAKLVTEASDILEELNIASLGSQLEMPGPSPELGPVESQLLSLLTGEPAHIDEITRASGMPSSVVSATLTMLELAGQARQVGPMTYVAAPSVAGRNAPARD